jgi:hypothetical protein
MEILGLSRTRDKKGNIVNYTLNPFVNCVHAHIGHAFDTMQVLVVEVEDEQE